MDFSFVSPIIGDVAPSSGASRHLLPAGEKRLSLTSAPSSPRRGEGGSRSEPGEGAHAAFAITAETVADVAARDALLDRAMGPGCKRKSSEKLRRGRKPSEGLAFAARTADGRIVGTVRLWDLALTKAPSSGPEPALGLAGGKTRGGHLLPAGEKREPAPSPAAQSGGAAPSSPQRGEGGSRSEPGEGALLPALLLGPLAVEPSLKNAGIGASLMRHAIAEARRLGHRAILLVGDAPYYARFGFSAEKTGSLAMPGPYERHRLLALELEEGALEGAHGVITACGRKLEARPMARPASRQAAAW